MFTKDERSTFPYWFAHWCAFNMTALNLGCWKFHHLFHDFEKPWIRLFRPYPVVQKIHRKYTNHHVEYFLKNHKANWLDMALDWECSRFTKTSSPMNCRKYVDVYLEKHNEISDADKQEIRTNILKCCDELRI